MNVLKKSSFFSLFISPYSSMRLFAFALLTLELTLSPFYHQNLLMAHGRDSDSLREYLTSVKGKDIKREMAMKHIAHEHPPSECEEYQENNSQENNSQQYCHFEQRPQSCE